MREITDRMRNVFGLTTCTIATILLVGCHTQAARTSGLQADLVSLHGPFHAREWNRRAAKGEPLSSRREIAWRRWDAAIEAAAIAGRPMPILARIEANKTALLVVDMQRAFLDQGASIEVPEGREIVENINRLSEGIRREGGSVIFFRYLVDENAGLLKYFEGRSYLGEERVSPMLALQRGHPQFELHPGLDVRDSDLIVDKTRYSAVLGSEIVKILRERNIENVIVTGVTTDVCAGNTAEDLMQMDFHVVMVWDGTAALDRLEHELYLARIFGLYGDVMHTEEVLLRLK